MADQKEQLYALVIKDDSFPKGCCPVGTAAEMSAMYQQLIERNVMSDQTMNIIERKAMLKEYGAKTQLFALKGEPRIQVTKADPVTAFWNGLNVKGAIRNAREKIENFDSKQVRNAAIKYGPTAAKHGVTLWQVRKGNILAILQAGKELYDAKDSAQKVAKDFFEAAKDKGEDIKARMNGLDESVDGIVYNGVAFVKEEWIVTPPNAAKVRDMNVVFAAAEQAQPPKKGGPGGMA